MNNHLQILLKIAPDLSNTQHLVKTTQDDGQKLEKNVEQLSSSVDENAADLK